jgi:hypothetical protein
LRCASRLRLASSALLLSQAFAKNTASSPNTTAKAIMTMVLVRTLSPVDATKLLFQASDWYGAGVELVKRRAVFRLC